MVEITPDGRNYPVVRYHPGEIRYRYTGSTTFIIQL